MNKLAFAALSALLTLACAKSPSQTSIDAAAPAQTPIKPETPAAKGPCEGGAPALAALRLPVAFDVKDAGVLRFAPGSAPTFVKTLGASRASEFSDALDDLIDDGEVMIRYGGADEKTHTRYSCGLIVKPNQPEYADAVALYMTYEGGRFELTRRKIRSP